MRIHWSAVVSLVLSAATIGYGWGYRASPEPKPFAPPADAEQWRIGYTAGDWVMLRQEMWNKILHRYYGLELFKLAATGDGAPNGWEWGWTPDAGFVRDEQVPKAE